VEEAVAPSTPQSSPFFSCLHQMAPKRLSMSEKNKGPVVLERAGPAARRPRGRPPGSGKRGGRGGSRVGRSGGRGVPAGGTSSSAAGGDGEAPTAKRP
jgi:hypothetical protein